MAWVLEQEHGLEVPKAMHPELGAAVQKFADEAGREMTSEEVHAVFEREFVNPKGPYELVAYWPRPDDVDPTRIHGEVRIRIHGEEKTAKADGNGPISAFVHALHKLGVTGFAVDDYDEQAVGKGADAHAVAYVPLKRENDGILYGVGRDTNIDQAAVRAIVAGLNRMAECQ